MKASRVILLTVFLLAALAVPLTARLVTSASPPNLGPAVHITPVARTTAPPTAPPTPDSSPTTAPPPKATQAPTGAQQVRPKAPVAGDDDEYDDDDTDDDEDDDEDEDD